MSCGGGTLRANSILVNGGTFAIGAAHRPYPHDVTITLSHNAALDDYGSATHPGEMLDQALVVQDGGILEFHGRDHGKSWTQLAETAMPGDTQIRLTEASAWEPGQEIVLASTDYDLNQAEVQEIAQVNGDVVTLTAPLFNMHWGEIEGPFANGMSVDERGEVGLLSRSIVVQGTPFTPRTAASWADTRWSTAGPAVSARRRRGRTSPGSSSATSTARARSDAIRFTCTGRARSPTRASTPAACATASTASSPSTT